MADRPARALSGRVADFSGSKARPNQRPRAFGRFDETTKCSSPDAGFILLDAVLAAGLLAFAGTVIIMIASTMLTQQQRELDRSVALVGSQSLIKQYLLFGASAGLEREDELFVYSFEPGSQPVAGTAALAEVTLWARPKSGRAVDAVRLDFLAPAAAR